MKDNLGYTNCFQIARDLEAFGYEREAKQVRELIRDISKIGSGYFGYPSVENVFYGREDIYQILKNEKLKRGLN